MGRQRIMVIMNYKERVNRVIDFIGRHLDEDLELEELCRIACFSKYHFHRLFTLHAGVSLKSYIKWLRLKRAAHQLTVQKEDTIINIALDAGFESHEAFSRAFKQVCGQSPSGFRSNANWRAWENPPYSLHIKGKQIMTITIKYLPSRRLAVMEHHGDPRETPPEEWRFDLALTVPKDFKLSDEVIDRELPAGRYAVTTHQGSRDNIGNTIYHLYRDWLPESGEELGDLPCIFCYHNFDHEVAETELLTEILVLLK